MNTQPAHQNIKQQEIHFSNGNRAQAIIVPVGTPISALQDALSIPPPKNMIIISGGASQMSHQFDPDLVRLFTSGITHLLSSANTLIIDGGTHAGVMAIIGQEVAEQQPRPTLLGVSPAGDVTYPGKITKTTRAESIPLDPNHSHFVLVETDEWGGETDVMYALAQSLSNHCPSAAVLVDGGSIAKNEILYNVRQRRPIIVIEGSGRLADDISRLWREKPSSIPDPALAEIIMYGDLHLFPLTGSATDLAQLTLRLLAKE